MIVITDLLRCPFDEGAKNTALNIINILNLSPSNQIVSINGSSYIGTNVLSFDVNKTFFDFYFIVAIKGLHHKNILYIPESSSTFFSLVRGKLLSVLTGKKVYILALQPRKFSFIESFFLSIIAPKIVITPSKPYADYLHKNRVRSRVIPLGVDDIKFYRYEQVLRDEIRAKNNIVKDKIILLHVGHICSSRNLEWLIDVKEKLSDIEVVIVGSSYNKANSKLETLLKSHGIKVMDQFVKNMAEIYNMADYYFFPVVDDQGAISTPLSVLEAMSCNIPVITTRFGSLVDMFEQDDHFYFVDNSSDVLAILREKKALKTKCNNRLKIHDYSWRAITGRIESIVEGKK